MARKQGHCLALFLRRVLAGVQRDTLIIGSELWSWSKPLHEQVPMRKQGRKDSGMVRSSAGRGSRGTPPKSNRSGCRSDAFIYAQACSATIFLRPWTNASMSGSLTSLLRFQECHVYSGNLSACGTRPQPRLRATD